MKNKLKDSHNKRIIKNFSEMYAYTLTRARSLASSYKKQWESNVKISSRALR